VKIPRPYLHNVFVLATAQAFASSGLTVAVILGGIIAAQIAPRASLATVPISTAVVATALTTVPAALLMRRIGRRLGFMTGALIGVSGGLVAAYAVREANFVLFCAGTTLLGSSVAFTQQYRFAAAESVLPEMYSSAVSCVLIGALAGALINPQLALLARWWIPDAEYAGSFLAVSLFFVVAMLVLSRLRPTAVESPRETSAHASAGALFSQPAFRVAVIASAIAYAVMTFIMTAAPISMHNFHHFDVEATTWVVQSHVLAMFLPSLFTGYAISRFGERAVMMWGGALLVACAVVSALGHHFMHYWTGLVALGIGWNLLFVAGTTLLTRTVVPANRHRAQAINEFTVFGSQACASLLAGVAVESIGWRAMNLATLPLLALVFLSAYRLRARAPAAVRLGAARDA
jgi:MFS family permease